MPRAQADQQTETQAPPLLPHASINVLTKPTGWAPTQNRHPHTQLRERRRTQHGKPRPATPLPLGGPRPQRRRGCRSRGRATPTATRATPPPMPPRLRLSVRPMVAHRPLRLSVCNHGTGWHCIPNVAHPTESALARPAPSGRARVSPCRASSSSSTSWARDSSPAPPAHIATRNNRARDLAEGVQSGMGDHPIVRCTGPRAELRNKRRVGNSFEKLALPR